MNRGIIFFTLAAIVLAGCGKSEEEKAITLVKSDVSNHFKDPSSTMFRNVVSVDRGNSQWAVCGEVNAKNGFGGYVGYIQFYGETQIYESTMVAISSIPSSPEENAMWAYREKNCK